MNGMDDNLGLARNDPVSEFEKMVGGLEYNCKDPELVRRK
jgi:hypothetical protein